jgi:hypothetical protein
MKIQLLASASQDLIEGFDFYEEQSAGVGQYFLESLYSDIDSLLITAGVHPVYDGQYHRLLSKRFPFAVYYLVENSTAFVYAILDCRRSPAWIKKKLVN